MVKLGVTPELTQDLNLKSPVLGDFSREKVWKEICRMSISSLGFVLLERFRT